MLENLAVMESEWDFASVNTCTVITSSDFDSQFGSDG